MSQVHLKVGAVVHCRDERAGSLHRVVFDPQTYHVVDLVIERGVLQKRDRVIPVSVVEYATVDDVYLTINSEHLSGYPEYHELDYELPASGWEPIARSKREQVHVWSSAFGIMTTEDMGVPRIRYHVPVGISSDLHQIGRKTLVHDQDGIVGKIDHLLVDKENWEITHLIVRRGILAHELTISMARVAFMDNEGIFIQSSEGSVL